METMFDQTDATRHGWTEAQLERANRWLAKATGDSYARGVELRDSVAARFNAELQRPPKAFQGAAPGAGQAAKGRATVNVQRAGQVLVLRVKDADGDKGVALTPQHAEALANAILKVAGQIMAGEAPDPAQS